MAHFAPNSSPALSAETAPPVILATTSQVRVRLLREAGVNFSTAASGVDEDSAKMKILAAGGGPREVAKDLADAKALAISAVNPGALVIGADQTLDLDGELFDKVDTLEAARARLMQLRGRRHRLHAALSVARDGAVIWRDIVSPSLTMRAFSEAFLDAWLEKQGEGVLGSVGCYRLEAEGTQLFSAIEGDYFAILGLPLLGLLDLLRREGVIAA